MKTRIREEISDVITKDNDITDEDIFRKMARRIVSEMPYDDLKRIITFDKLDPNSEYSQKALNDPLTPAWLVNTIIELQYRNSILYEAYIELT